MNKIEKALANLEEKGVTAKLENNTIYVVIGDSELEISQFEIDFQADEWDCSKRDEFKELINQ
jgi:hypothetical protein